MHLIAALYKFTRISNPAALRRPLIDAAAREGVVGSLLLAPEGVNGTLAGPEAGLRRFLARLQEDPGVGALRWKESWSASRPFRTLKIRLKREIVSMGAPDLVTPSSVGTYVAPADWSAVLDDPSIAVIDVRNDYETALGVFDGAVDPRTARFRDFPSWATAWTPERQAQRARAVAMYCTGGIRCEKASAYLRKLGWEKVFHLEGGVLAYFDATGDADRRWRGHCFVFDERVSVGPDLRPGPHDLCRGCRRPLSPADKAHPAYEEGVCCAACAKGLDAATRDARRERRRQIALNAAHGRSHLAGAGEDLRNRWTRE